MIKRIFSGFLAGLLAVAPLDYLAAQTATLPISQLPTAVLPLAGTEVVPLVQNGITRKTPASNFGIFSADNLNNFPGATADQKLVAAIVSGKTHVQLSSSASFFNTLPIELPTNFFLDCNGFTIFKLASNTSMFTMDEAATIANCSFNGEGNLGYTGEIIHIVAHNNQALYNVRFVNSLGANLEIDSDTGINFTWVGGSFNRTDFTLPAVLMPLADSGTSGLRRFTDLQGNGSWFMDTRGSNLTIVEGVGMNCLTIGATTNYLMMHNSRPACHPTILGTNGQYKGVIFDAGVTIGSGAQFNIIEQQLGLTITDSSGNTTNMIIPMTGNTYTQYMQVDGQIGWDLRVAGNDRLAIGTIVTTNIPYLRTKNGLALNFGVNTTDYFQLAPDGGYYALGATGGSQGPGTINAHTKIAVDGVPLSGTVTSVTCGTGLTGGTITLSGTCALDVAHANSWTALQSHAAGDFAMAGTAHGLVVSENASAAVTTAAGTNGQILTGQTGADPLWETMTGDCTFTAGGVLGCTKQNGVSFPSSFTSGGIPYASSTSAISSSGLLTQHAIVLGGGAGASPTVVGSLGTSATVLHGAAAGDPTFGAVSLTADVTNTLPVGNGGSGTATAFTLGSAVFAGASGVYTQDNANYFWDATNHRLGVGTTAPLAPIEINANSGTPAASLTAGTLFYGLGANSATTRFNLDAYGTGVTGAFQSRVARGTAASPTASQNADVLFQLGGFGYGATGFGANASGVIQFAATENFSDTAVGGSILFATVKNTTTTRTTVATLDGYGHMGFSGPSAAVPTISGCGTSPSVARGSDTAGEVTEGTTATGCVITFANAYTAAPYCTVTSQTQLAAFTYALSTTAITVTNTSTSGDKINWICHGL